MAKKSSLSANPAEAMLSPDGATESSSTLTVIEAPVASRKAVEQLSQDIIHAHLAFRDAMVSGLEHALTAGGALLAARPLVGHGHFERWIKENFESQYGLAERTAQRYMQLAQFEPEIRAFLRDAKTTRVSDSDDEDVFAKLSINQALRIVSQLKQAKKGCAPKRKSVSTAPWKACRMPQAVVERLQTFCGTIDSYLSVIEEEAPFPTARLACGPVALRQPGEVSGRVVVNAVARAEITTLITALMSAAKAGAIAEACVLLPTSSAAICSGPLTSSPRVFLTDQLTVPVLVNGTVSNRRLPVPVALFYIGPTERLTALDECFAGLGTTFVPLRTGDLG